MKIVRDAVLRDNKKLPISIIIISALMLLLSFIDFSIVFVNGEPVASVEFFNSWLMMICVIPLTFGISTAMLMKTKKTVFSKLPSYIVCSIVVIAFVLFYIASGQDNLVVNILGFAIAILLIYPFIIAVLTIEGRMYNRVFALIFAGILLVLTVAAAIALFVVLELISLSYFIPALVYVELILTIMSYELKPKSKEKILYDN